MAVSSSSVSPRSSTLPRSMPISSCYTKEWTAQLEENILPVLLVAAAVASAVVAWIARDYEMVTHDRKWPHCSQSGVLAGVSMLAALGCAAWVTSRVYEKSDHFYRMLLLGLFAASAVLLGVVAWMYFRTQEMNVAFYLACALVAVLLGHTYVCFRYWGSAGVLAMVPAVLLALFVAWCLYPDDGPMSVTSATA